jgi:Hemerythrin HHE cation binding domain
MSVTTAPAANVPQLFLPGQAAAPEGPVQAMPMYLMHHAFRRDLAAFAAAVPLTPLEDRATWRRLRDRWELFAHVLHKHHSGEDAGLWPLLLDRVDAAGDTEGRRTLEAMEAEHEDIDPTLQACAEGFARLAETPDADARAALAVRLVAAREGLGAHLVHEERDAMALVQRHMTQQDWDHMVEEHFDKGVTPKEQVRTLPWAAHGLSAADAERVAAIAGRAVVVVWRLFLKRPFERRERAAFRYLPTGS